MHPPWPFRAEPGETEDFLDEAILNQAENVQCRSTLLTVAAEIRRRIWDYAVMPHEPVDLLQPAPPDYRVLLSCRQMHNEVLEFYQAAGRFGGYWWSQEYWTNTVFYLDGSQNVMFGMFVLQNRTTPQLLSCITRLRLQSSQPTVIFSFYHGVWRCTAPCCHPAPPQPQSYAAVNHPQRVIVLPRRQHPAPGRLDYSLVRTNYLYGSDLPQHAPGAWHGYFPDRLRVAELRTHVLVDTGLARLATGELWTELTIREVVGMWAYNNDVA